MYRSKTDVDKHVENLQTKLSPKEFQTRAYSIARLYFEVGDYENCRQYVEQYLKVKDNSASGYKLLGQAFQKLGFKSKAIENFKTSLHFDRSQTNLILTICEILLEDDSNCIDLAQTRYWCNMAEQSLPNSPILYRLKERLIQLENTDPKALFELLTAEVKVRPKDVTLHQRLLKYYLNTNELEKAFQHAFDIEFGDANPFIYNIVWYETVADVLRHVEDKKIKMWEYQLLNLTVAEKLCHISLTEVPTGPCKSLVESLAYLHSYDQDVLKINKVGVDSNNTDFISALINHHRGQLCFLMAIFILKKAKKEQLSWSEATQYAYPLLSIAYNVAPVDKKSKWTQNISQKQQIVLKRLFVEGSFRCSQTGYCLLSAAEEKSHTFIDNLSQTCSGSWKIKFYNFFYKQNDLSVKQNSSFFVKDSSVIFNMRVLRASEIKNYDSQAQRMYPNSLHHMVWLLLNYKNMADFNCVLYEMLKPLSRSYTSCGPETLNNLDMDSFLYCAALSAQSRMKNERRTQISADRPKVIPSIITDLLCSVTQVKWWDCAHKISQNEFGSDFTDVRLTISRGIEVIRCVDNHGIDVKLLCMLGRIFLERSNAAKSVDTKINLEARANLYYSAAIPLLDKIKNKLNIRLPEKRLFDYTSDEINSRELNNLLEECKLVVGEYLMKENDYEKAILTLSSLKTPMANLHLSKIYKKMADNELNISYDNGNSDTQSKHITLLNKSKECAYSALDKLKRINQDMKNPLFAETHQLIEQIESQISRIDPDCITIDGKEYDIKYSSDESASSNTSGLYYNNMRVTNNTLNPTLSSTPLNRQRLTLVNNGHRTNNVDSLHQDKIESQIKSLKHAFVSQSKTWNEVNDNLAHEVREIKSKLADQIVSSINSKMQDTIDQFKLLKLSVDQVKDKIFEYRTECQNVVGDLKKEVKDLKKEIDKLKSSTLLDESEDFQGNESTSTFPGHVSFPSTNALPNFNQRLVPPVAAVAPNAYQLYGQNLYSLYNQYSQLAQTSHLPPIFDTARAQLNYPAMYPDAASYYQEFPNLLNAHLNIPVPSSVPNVIPPVSMPQTKPVTPSSVSITPTTQHLKKEIATSLPVNVVITSSDPLPTMSSAPQPILSVTIPPEHIKSSPHNYQIPMPSNANTSLFSTITSSQAKPFKVWDHPVMSTTSKSDSLFSTSKVDIAGSPNVNISWGTPSTSLNKSRTLSEKSNNSETYDPCPDFKPIVPLPDEVKVTTGEEDEEVIFNERSKLYRFVDKEWKERGIGLMKLLKHKVTGKVRVLMRREQVHKICANHIITHEIEMKPMKNESKAYFWVANDFADEKLVLEKFCIRFKTSEIAKRFYDTFEKARVECKPADEVQTKTEESKKTFNEKVKGFGDQFKAAIGSWNCSVCYINNQANIMKCAACETMNPNAPETTEVAANPTTNTFTLPKFGISSAATLEKDQQKTDNKEDKPHIFSNFTFKGQANTNFSNIFSNILPTTSATPTPIVTKPMNMNVAKGAKNCSVSTANTSESNDEFIPTAEFAPVVPLPALIESKTGEEDENIIFEHRSKLLRYDFKSKEWKERGLGNIKLLVRKDDQTKVRLLMRREQIMKVCCNHSLTKEMKFEKMPNVSQAVTWCAKDFSDGDLVNETFCLRFKTPTLADEFLLAVQGAQKKIKTEVLNKSSEEISSQSESSAKTTGWGDKFKPKSGSWECNQCFVRNEANVDYCSACEAPKDPNMHRNDQVKKSSDVLSAPKFNFGIPSATNAPKQETQTVSLWNTKKSTGFSFGIKDGDGKIGELITKSSDITNENKPSLETVENKPSQLGCAGNMASFGAPSLFGTTESKTLNFGTPESKTSLFGVPTNSHGSIFGTPENKSVIGTAESKSVFGGQASTKSFDFTLKPKESSIQKSPVNSPQSNADQSHENVSDDEGNNIYFTPVVPLPDKVDVVTGEENEDELYSQRAKLFKFVSGEWKERGIGDLKILKHKINGVLRILMRRERVHKICLNHILTSDIVYKSKDEKSWIFSANDYSEGKIELLTFCLRFASNEIAKQFKSELDKALAGKIAVTSEAHKKDSEVEFVSEIKPSDEERMKALSLMLPENFFNYKHKDKCTGCRGCSDDYSQSEIENEDEKQVVQASTPLKSSSNINVTESPVSSGQATPSIFGTPNLSNTTIFASPLNMTKHENNSSLETPKINVTKNEDNSVTFTRQGSLFGGLPKNMFGTPKDANKSIFGTPLGTVENKDNAQESNMFGGTGNGSLFSKKEESKENKAVSLSGSIFENVHKPTFGEIKPFPQPKNDSLFSQPMGLLSKPEVTNGGFLFGSQAKENDSLFKNIAANNKQNIFMEAVKANKPSESSGSLFGVMPDVDENIFGAELDTSKSNYFSELASNGSSFKTKAKPENFQWEGAGQQLFGNKKPPTAEEHNNSESKGDEDYDPYYEPIVPLPDKIVVTTGEEDEEKLFSERSKLFRYDEASKEWKERGVGELKILYHPQKNTFRLLMRRDQVYKLVLNMLLHQDFELLPMKTATNAFTFPAVNYAESNTGITETLALRFKNVKITDAFKTKVIECVRKLQVADAKAYAASKGESFGLGNKSSELPEPNTLSSRLVLEPEIVISEPYIEEEVDDEEHYDYEGYAVYDDNDEVEITLTRCKADVRLTWSSGEDTYESDMTVNLTHEPGSEMARLSIVSTHEQACMASLIININTNFKLEGKNLSVCSYEECSSNDVTVTIMFANESDAISFHDKCMKSLSYAFNDENDDGDD